MKSKTIHISELQQGDTIIINGEMETVSIKNITNDFMGIRYNGNGFRETNGMVEVALFPKWYQGEITGYHKQI